MQKTYRIPGIDSDVEGIFKQWQRIILVRDPVLPERRSKASGTENNLRYVKTGVSYPLDSMSVVNLNNRLKEVTHLAYSIYAATKVNVFSDQSERLEGSQY